MGGDDAGRTTQSAIRVFKNPLDPARACEVGTPVPVLPWEGSHRVEWRIQNLDADRKLQQVKVSGMEVPAGKSMASPPFAAAGVRGILRFWPNGYFNSSQRRERGEMDLGGLNADAWCALGVFVPRGTRWRLRFFVGDKASPWRETYWNDGVTVTQLWTPAEADPPPNLEQGIVVGVEISHNLRDNPLREDPKRCTMDSLATRVFMPKVELQVSGSDAAKLMHTSPRLAKPWLLSADALQLPHLSARRQRTAAVPKRCGET